jgi:hypothetical protein
MYDIFVRRSEVYIQSCANKEADDVFLQHYWMRRVRRSRRLSYAVFYSGEKVAWIQIADPFGTKLTKPLQVFDIQEVVELCRGYFIDDAPSNIESCAIGKILRVLPNDWYSHWGIMKKIAIVYQDVDVHQRGVVYKALGFRPYACCIRARHYTAPTRGNSIGNKILWARKLRPTSGQHYKVLMPEANFLMLDIYNNYTSKESLLVPNGKFMKPQKASIKL